MHVLKPLEPPFAPEITEILKGYPQDESGYILKLFRVFANSVRFATTKGVSNLLDKDSPLSLREREIVILRVTANANCEYEWGVHVSVFSEAARLTEEQVAASRSGASDAGCWNEQESVLIECVDQLCERSTIDGEAHRRFREIWTVEQQLEILSLCGNYHLVSFVANTSRIDNEPWAAVFPS